MGKYNNLPSELEIKEYFHSLSNWGRSGEDDQIGTLILITASVIYVYIKKVVFKRRNYLISLLIKMQIK